MTMSITELDAPHKAWVQKVNDFMDQISGWATALGWKVEREQTMIHEKGVGDYELPLVRVLLPQGEIEAMPIGLHGWRKQGRIDFRAIPTIAFLRFDPTPDGWRIMTDSHIPLRIPWNQESFAQVVTDMIGD
jgi:hypothetical protein